MLTAASVRSFKLPRFHVTHFTHSRADCTWICCDFFIRYFVRFSLSGKFWGSENFAIIHLYILFSSFFTSVCNQQHALMLALADSQQPQLRRKLFKQLKHTSTRTFRPPATVPLTEHEKNMCTIYHLLMFVSILFHCIGRNQGQEIDDMLRKGFAEGSGERWVNGRKETTMEFVH